MFGLFSDQITFSYALSQFYFARMFVCVPFIYFSVTRKLLSAQNKMFLTVMDKIFREIEKG